MPRLDQEIYNRGLAASRNRAANFILDGLVRVNGKIAHKPSQKVSIDCEILVDHKSNPWVSRAALKLAPFLEDHTHAVALDLGASTGGFTQALIAHGARKVFAVDVGQGQLDPSLKNDPRVISLENTNAKNLNPNSFNDNDWPNFSVLTSDLSFISLRKAL